MELANPFKLNTQPNSTHFSIARNATWTVSNLLRGDSPPKWKYIAHVIPELETNFAVFMDTDVIRGNQFSFQNTSFFFVTFCFFVLFFFLSQITQHKATQHSTI